MALMRAACLQVNAGPDIGPNVDNAVSLARRARAEGADFILMPENVAMMEWGRANVLTKAVPEIDHPALAAFRDLARELGVWLHCGTLAVLVDADRVANRCYVVAPNGSIAARYDKLHMFDVDLPGGESYRESATFEPGETAVALDLPWGRLGLTICYDLRFPQLYRALARAGCDMIAVPSAFTRQTGEAHWHVLLRARAIECGSFILAPAQTGEHKGGRQTYGHSLVVDPWGRVLADAGTAPGIVMADLDLALVTDARNRLPTLAHDRPFSLEVSRDPDLVAAVPLLKAGE